MSGRTPIRRRLAESDSKRQRKRLASESDEGRVQPLRNRRIVIDVVNQQKNLRIAPTRIRLVARQTLAAEMVENATISVALVDNRTIHLLNRRHLNHDYETDVLSFLFESEAGDPVKLPKNSSVAGPDRYIDGEIVISAEMAVHSAVRVGWSASKELELYLVHGLLHLCGYDDQTDAQRRLMRRRERSILRLVGN
jgi:probable rRNA maturation factor